MINIRPRHSPTVRDTSAAFMSAEWRALGLRVCSTIHAVRQQTASQPFKTEDAVRMRNKLRGAFERMRVPKLDFVV